MSKKVSMKQMQRFVAQSQKNAHPPGNLVPAILPTPPAPETPPEKQIAFGEIVKGHDRRLYGANQVVPGAEGKPPCADCGTTINQKPGGVQWFRWSPTLHQPLCPVCAQKIGLVTTDAPQPRVAWPVGQEG